MLWCQLNKTLPWCKCQPFICSFSVIYEKFHLLFMKVSCFRVALNSSLYRYLVKIVFVLNAKSKFLFQEICHLFCIISGLALRTNFETFANGILLANLLAIPVMILSFRTDRSGQTVQTQVWSGSTLFAIPSASFGLMDSLLYGKAT